METIIYFPLRLLTFAIGLFLYWMEIASDWVIGVRSKTEYVRTGLCNRCGRCCRLLALEMPLFISRHDFLVRIISWWHRLCFNFNYEGNNGRWLVYRCGYLTDRCNAPISHPERSEGSHSDHGILHFVQNDNACTYGTIRILQCELKHRPRPYPSPESGLSDNSLSFIIYCLPPHHRADDAAGKLISLKRREFSLRF